MAGRKREKVRQAGKRASEGSKVLGRKVGGGSACWLRLALAGRGRAGCSRSRACRSSKQTAHHPQIALRSPPPPSSPPQAFPHQAPHPPRPASRRDPVPPPQPVNPVRPTAHRLSAPALLAGPASQVPAIRRAPLLFRSTPYTSAHTTSGRIRDIIPVQTGRPPAVPLSHHNRVKPGFFHYNALQSLIQKRTETRFVVLDERQEYVPLGAGRSCTGYST